MLLTQLPRTVKISAILGAILTILLVLHSLADWPIQVQIARQTAEVNHELGEGQVSPGSSIGPDSGPLPCRTLPGADDVLVVMRTGASEIKDKLPVGLPPSHVQEFEDC